MSHRVPNHLERLNKCISLGGLSLYQEKEAKHFIKSLEKNNYDIYTWEQIETMVKLYESKYKKK